MNSKLIKIKNKKYVLIDIGLWILILARIIKIITVVRSMKNNNLRNFLITLCSSLSSMWFLYFVQHPKAYTISSALEAVITVLLMGGVGIYAIYKDNINKIPKLSFLYSIILLVIGTIDMSMDMSFIGASDFSNFILISSILCEALYILSGGYILLFSL